MAKRYGPWIPRRSLDEGGQAHLFIVVKEGAEDGTEHVLKRLKNPGRLDRFRREVDITRQLTSRYIVEVVDYDTEAKEPYYVLPYYPNGNAQQASMHTAAVGMKLEFYEHILEGMASAHGAGVVHRDLKPQNILVTGEWAPAIADFGICFVEDGERFTLTDEKAGNIDFSAPEVLEGRQDDVSARSDVYSLGKLLYWLLTGIVVPRERYRDDNFDLKSVLGNTKYEAFTRFLDKMIVEPPEDRLEDAAAVLNAFRHSQELIHLGANLPSPDIPQRCIYCRDGTYTFPKEDVREPDGSTFDTKRVVGITAVGSNRFRVMICDQCGNVQIFKVRDDRHQILSRNPWRRSD
jgi:serine/threonine protein kinase